MIGRLWDHYPCKICSGLSGKSFWWILLCDWFSGSSHGSKHTLRTVDLSLLKWLEQRDCQGQLALDLGFGAVPQVFSSFYSPPQAASKKRKRGFYEDTSCSGKGRQPLAILLWDRC